MIALAQLRDFIKSGQQLPSVLIGYGDESYYINRLEELVINNYISQEVRSTQMVVYFGADITAPEVLQLAQTVSMFDPKRLIVL